MPVFSFFVNKYKRLLPYVYMLSRPILSPLYYKYLLPFFMVALVFASPVQALQIKLKDRDIHFFIDSIFTASAAMRTQTGQAGIASGNRNIFPDGGDIYSTPLSLVTDISISKGELGAFARVSYSYDQKILNTDCSNCFRPTPQMTLNGIDDAGQNLAGNKFRLLDAFIFNTWHFGETPLNVRVGKQVISWGESNIIGGGISQMQNPIDLAKATTPGTEIKETLMPQESVYLQLGLTANVSVEAYYVWNWRPSVLIPVGTFFSPSDLLGAGYNPDIAPGVLYKGRDESSEPDGEQWGMSVSTYMDSWNGTDLSFYWVRSHAFLPYLTIDDNYNVPDPVLGGLTAGGYEKVYSEDQDTFGVSVGGLFPGKLGISFQAELNYRPDFYGTRKCVSCSIGNSDITTLLGGVVHSANYDFLGSDNVSLVLDMQMQHINKLDDARGTSASGSKITDFSWGYLTVVSLDYLDLFANIKVSPSLVWIHDVKGFEPGAAGGLKEDEQIVSASVNFSYLSQASMKFTYSSWLGDNGGSYDRDNVSLSFKYNF